MQVRVGELLQGCPRFVGSGKTQWHPGGLRHCRIDANHTEKVHRRAEAESDHQIRPKDREGGTVTVGSESKKVFLIVVEDRPRKPGVALFRRCLIWAEMFAMGLTTADEHNMRQLRGSVPYSL